MKSSARLLLLILSLLLPGRAHAEGMKCDSTDSRPFKDAKLDKRFDAAMKSPKSADTERVLLALTSLDLLEAQCRRAALLIAADRSAEVDLASCNRRPDGKPVCWDDLSTEIDKHLVSTPAEPVTPPPDNPPAKPETPDQPVAGSKPAEHEREPPGFELGKLEPPGGDAGTTVTTPPATTSEVSRLRLLLGVEGPIQANPGGAGLLGVSVHLTRDFALGAAFVQGWLTAAGQAEATWVPILDALGVYARGVVNVPDTARGRRLAKDPAARFGLGGGVRLDLERLPLWAELGVEGYPAHDAGYAPWFVLASIGFRVDFGPWRAN